MANESIREGSASGPVLIYDDGSTHAECSGDDLKIGAATNAGQLQTYSELAFTGTAALVKLPL